MKKGREESAFLAAILEQPGDSSPRLIYADWLEERDDPRGELIRLEEAMRDMPIFIDRYWELKPRRNLLRVQCGKHWLKMLGYGTDYEPVFREVPEGWKERWRLIREFIERWYKVPVGDVGSQRKRIHIIEKKLGYELPPSIREWVALLRDLIDTKGYDLVIRDCLSFEELEEHPALSLMIQGEGDYHWAVRKKHLRSKDPPVDGYRLDYEDEENRFVHDKVWAPRVSTWALGHILVNLQSEGKEYAATIPGPIGLTKKLSRAFPVVARFDDTHIFEATNMLAVVSPEWGFGGGARLAFHTWKKIPKKEFPDIVREYLQ